MDKRLHFLEDTCIEAHHFVCRGCGATSTPDRDELEALYAAQEEGEFFDDGWYCADCAAARMPANRRWWCHRCGWRYEPFGRGGKPPTVRLATRYTFEGEETYEVVACPVCGVALREEVNSEAVEPSWVTENKLQRWRLIVVSVR